MRQCVNGQKDALHFLYSLEFIEYILISRMLENNSVTEVCLPSSYKRIHACHVHSGYPSGPNFR